MTPSATDHKFTIETDQEEIKLISRRDVLKVAWTTPVVLAFSPSLEVLPGSGNIVEENLEGLTPGRWRQINNDNNDNSNGNDPSQNSWDGVMENSNYTPNSSYSDVFGVQPYFGNLSLSQTVELKGGGEKALARHATAGLLNAANPTINYPYTEQQIIDMVQTAYQTNDFETPKNLLDAANNLGATEESTGNSAEGASGNTKKVKK